MIFFAQILTAMIVKNFVFNPFMENTYVLHDETGDAVIIDAGCLFPDEQEQLRQYIDYANLRLKYVLNTHLHLDHQFGNAFLARTYGVMPMAHEGDAVMAGDIARQAAAFGIPVHVEDCALGGFLSDGQKLRAGNLEIEVIHTSGHSKGGVCFYIPSEKVVFAGDTLFQNSIGRTDLPGGNHAQLIGSIRKRLFVLPDDTVVYTGHGEPTVIGDEKSYNPYL